MIIPAPPSKTIGVSILQIISNTTPIFTSKMDVIRMNFTAFVVLLIAIFETTNIPIQAKKTSIQ